MVHYPKPTFWPPPTDTTNKNENKTVTTPAVTTTESSFDFPENVNRELYSKKEATVEWLFTVALMLGDQGYVEEEILINDTAAVIGTLTLTDFQHPYRNNPEGI